MTQSTANRSAGRGSSPWVHGLTLFAGIMMVIIGILDFFYGIMAIAKDDIYVHAPNYVFKFSTTSWGWIHLILGILLIVVGAGLLMGQGWARMVGIFVVAISTISNFLAIPYYPLWSVSLLALDIFVIWALARPESEEVF